MKTNKEAPGKVIEVDFSSRAIGSSRQSHLSAEKSNPYYLIGELDLPRNCDTCREFCISINNDGSPTIENVVCNSENDFDLYCEDIRSCKNCEFSLKWVDYIAIQEYPDPDILLTCYAFTKIQGHSIIDVFDGVKSFSKDLVRLALVERFGWCPNWKLDGGLKTTHSDDKSIDKGGFALAVQNARQTRMDGYVPGYHYDDISMKTGDFS